jgi:hypothetical protein
MLLSMAGQSQQQVCAPSLSCVMSMCAVMQHSNLLYWITSSAVREGYLHQAAAG